MWAQVLLTATEFAVESTYDTSFLIHLVIYGLLAAIITYLLLQKSYKPRTPTVLTASVLLSFKSAGIIIFKRYHQYSTYEPTK